MEWLTRQEAAAYLKVSVRQLGRLPVPRSILGASPRYSQEEIDRYLEASSHTPGQRRPHELRTRIRGRLLSGPVNRDDYLESLKRRLAA